MNQIYDKINRHEYLENEDIVQIITFFSKGKAKTIFVNGLDASAMFLYGGDNESSKILIKDDIKNEYLQYSKSWLEYYDIEDKNTALVDLYNLYLLWVLFHELGHFIQSVHMTKRTTRTEIIKATCEIANLNETNYRNYRNNSVLYCYELDANLLATIKMSNIIKNKVPNLNHISITIYNRIIAGHLCDSYGKKNKKQEKLYPILYTKLLVKHYYNIFGRIHINRCIERLEKKSTTEYRRLLNGFDLSGETIKLLHDVYFGIFKTDSILDEVKKIDKVKVR